MNKALLDDCIKIQANEDFSKLILYVMVKVLFMIK